MRCDRSGCELDAVCGFVRVDENEPFAKGLLRCDEHARELEEIVRAAASRPAGLIAKAEFRRVSVNEAAVTQVMET